MADDYLSVYDQQVENTLLGERRMQAANALNPLYQRDQAILAKEAGVPAPAEAETVSAAAPTSVLPNPLTRPSVPLSTMPTNQRIAWDTLNAQRQAEQEARENHRLAIAVKKSENDIRLEQVKQGNEIMANDIPALQTALNKGNLDDYLNLKADLFRRRPVGVGSPEIEKALKPLDDLYTKNLGFQEARNKSQITLKETNQQKRVNDGYEMAKALGPEVYRQYAAKVDADPENAIKYVTDLAIPAQRENTIANLKAAGFTPDQIAAYGTGADFKYQAAEEAVKTRASLTKERNSARQEWVALDAKRQKAGFDPNDPVFNADFTEDDWRAYQEAHANWKALTPQIGGNRGGIVGMGDLPMLPQGETYTTGRRAPVTPVAQTQATVPAGPVRSEAVFPSVVPAIGRLATVVGGMATAPMRLMTMSEAERAQRAAATPQAASAAKSPPPPLNPKYPEQWVGGKRYIQMPDGKLYLSKVQ